VGFARQQRVVFATLLVGYASFYLCRANVDAAVPLLVDGGWKKDEIGPILSIAVACYAVGKVVLGAIGDVIGGKRIMLVAIAGSIVATVGIGLSAGIAMFAAFAMATASSSRADGAGSCTSSRGGSARATWRVMGALSTSYEIGNVCALLFCGALAESGLGWQSATTTPTTRRFAD